MPLKTLLIFLLFPLLGLSQYASNEPDNASRFRPGVGWYFTGIRPAETQKVRKYDRLIFDITYNCFAQENLEFVTPGSIGFNTSMMFDKPLTKGNTLSLGYGVGYKRARFVTANKQLIGNPEFRNTAFIDNAHMGASAKSAFQYNVLYIPFEVRVRKASWSHLKFHIGAKAGWAFGAHSKFKSFVEGKQIVSRDYRYYDFSPIYVAFHARVGLRNWALFAEYGYLPMFQSSTSVQLNALHGGISISLY